MDLRKPSLQTGTFNLLHLIFILFVFGNIGCLKSRDFNELASGNFEQEAIRFAKSNLSLSEFNTYNWSKIKRVQHADSLIGWTVNALSDGEANLKALTIRTSKGIPVEITRHTILNPEVIATSVGILAYKKDDIISGKSNLLNIRVGEKERNNTGVRDPRPLMKNAIVAAAHCLVWW